MLKFNHISRAGTLGIFLWKNLTSLKRLKFHMHVSDDDSNMFCKFDEIWWTLKKCWNFMIFQRAGTVGIFLWNKSTSLNGLKFHMHVYDDDSNIFCKFDEIWWTLKKCWKFMIFIGPALLTFFYEISKLFWMGSNFTYMFLMMIPICSASLMKFGKLWKNVENMDISRAGTVGIFLWNKLTSLNGLKFHMHVSDDDSNKFCKFDEIWWLLKKCWNLIIFLGPAVSVFFCEIS